MTKETENGEELKLAGLLRDGKRMMSVLRQHVEWLERRHQREVEEWKQIPSRNQQYFYVADANGLIQLQQDAAFLVEAVLVANPTGGAPVAGPFFYEIAAEDANAGRYVTNADRVQVPETPATTVQERNGLFVPSAMLVPVSGTIGDFTIAPNTDYWLDLPVEWVLPRGSLLRVRFRTAGPQAPADNDLPVTVLSGYKVF